MLTLAIDPEERKARRREQLARADAKYKAANREKLNAASKEYREADLERAAKRMREYRAANPDVIAAIEARRVRSAEARAAFNAYRVQWGKKNPEKVSEYAHKRSGVRIARLPSGTIEKIGAAQRWKCACCAVSLKRAKYHKDHIIPLALGGDHVPSNIQLLCPSCNLSKGAKNPIDFMQSKGKLL